MLTPWDGGGVMTEINPGILIGAAGTLSGLLMAGLALAISRAPGWRELRAFSFVATAAAAYSFFNLSNVVTLSERDVLVGERLALASSLLYGLGWIRLFAISERRLLRTIENAAVFAIAVMAFLAVLPGTLVVGPLQQVRVEWIGVTYTHAEATPLGLFCLAFLFVAILGTAFGGGRRWRDGWHARLPMIGATVLVLTGICDTLTFTHVIAIPQMTEAMTVLVVGGIGMSYARRFVEDAGRLDALSKNLEQEVASRTRQLLEAQARADQHERLAGLGRIAAGVAHEINNPAMVILQNLEQLELQLEEAKAPATRERIERVRAATQHISAIVSQLLEVGRPPSSTTTPATAFAVAPVVSQAIAAASVSTAGIQVEVSVDGSLYARGDPRLLQQVIVNLLVNAAHALKERPAPGGVLIHAVRAGERVQLTVADDGPGISPAVRDRLFEPFATTKPVGEGTGLGLAVSRGLMVRQGGTLFVGRSDHEGTEMVLELPAAELASSPSATAPPTPASVPSAKRLRVLVIEDNDDLREVMTLALAPSFQVDAAASVDQALEVAAKSLHDVVLCDLMMPEGGAESWLARCTSIDPRLDPRTIVMTGGPTTPPAAALVEARRPNVLYKPAELAELQALIERVSRRA
ncbi:MAG: response regulator [Deltaproteobacteria bacterium]|nr:response regulator [Deltaproteobacteria bacterium]